MMEMNEQCIPTAWVRSAKVVTLAMLASFSASSLSLEGQVLTRVANTTLSLPAALPASEYDLELAFPEIRSFSQPVAMVSPPGESNRLFVLERVGRIRVIPDLDNPTRETFLSLTRNVESSSGEQGLLGLAFHPDYQRNGTFFVFYTARGSGAPNRLSRFQVNPDNPNEGLPDSEVILFSQRDDAGNHNGGDLHFGPDGYLYVALGDEGAANDTLNNSQRLDRDFFAGILRIDVDKRPGNLEPNPHPAIVFNEDGSANYSIPADNPFVEIAQFNGNTLVPQEVRTEFWAVGLRNPWRMSFDSVTGELYTGDVGQGRREEVDIIVKGGNYGWNYREGTLQGPNRRTPPDDLTFIEPILEYSRGSRSNQGNSITGGVVYRGSRLASLYGAYTFADFVSGNLWWLRRQATGDVDWENIGRETGISAFGVDPRNGDVLIADYNSNRLRRLVAAEIPEGTEATIPESLAETGAFSDLATLTPSAGVVSYSVNSPFWSDGAVKRRWFSIPDVAATMEFHPTDSWGFPAGSVWVKHFELELRSGDPTSRRRLETRFIVQQEGGVYGLTYRWDENQENAFLVPEEGLDEVFMIEDGGTTREQLWRYPSRGECISCHTQQAGGVLGFDTAQLSRDHAYGEQMAHQIVAMNEAGYFSSAVDGATEFERVVPPSDEETALVDRVRSYLDTNCSQCHRPGGESIGLWDARLTEDLNSAGIVGGALANPAIHPGRRVVVPGDPNASEMLRRMRSLGSDRMPPLGSHLLDEEGGDLIRRWIVESLPAETQEQWSERYFGSALNPRAAAVNDDDGDGYSNEMEFLLKTDPTDSDDAWQIRLERDDQGLFVRFPFVGEGTPLGIVLEQTTDLGPDAAWEPVSASVASPFLGPVGKLGEWRLDDPTAASRFFRASVSVAP